MSAPQFRCLLEIVPVKEVNAWSLSGPSNDRGVDQLRAQGSDPHDSGCLGRVSHCLGCVLDHVQQVQCKVHQAKVVYTKGDLQQQAAQATPTGS